MNHLFLLRTNVATGEYLTLRQSSTACLWSSPPAPAPSNWHLLGRDFLFKSPTCGSGKLALGQASCLTALTDPVSQSPRRHYNLRVKFQQKFVYVVLPAGRYLPLLENTVFFSSLSGQLRKSFQSKVSSPTCCLLETDTWINNPFCDKPLRKMWRLILK